MKRIPDISINALQSYQIQLLKDLQFTALICFVEKFCFFVPDLNNQLRVSIVSVSSLFLLSNSIFDFQTFLKTMYSILFHVLVKVVIRYKFLSLKELSK